MPLGGMRPGVASAVTAATLAWALALAPAACTDGAQPASYDAPRNVDQVMIGMSTEITSDGRRTLRVEADSAFSVDSTSVRTLIGVEARAFGENDLVRVTLQADSGRLDEETRVFTAQGNVTASTRDGAVSLETAELVYDPATNRFRSDSATVVEQRGRTERLPCFESDPLLTSWRQCQGTS